MTKLTLIGGLVFLSLLTFFGTALDSLDFRSKAEGDTSGKSALEIDVPNDLEVKSSGNQTDISFVTKVKYISTMKLGENPEKLNLSYIVSPELTTDHRLRLNNLKEGQQYFFQIQLIDVSGSSYFSKTYNFKTSR